MLRSGYGNDAQEVKGGSSEAGTTKTDKLSQRKDGYISNGHGGGGGGETTGVDLTVHLRAVTSLIMHGAVSSVPHTC
jgi:hypothetical protein